MLHGTILKKRMVMPNICKECNNDFPNWMEIDGKERNLSSRKFCLDCSPFKGHNTKVDVNAVSKRNAKHNFVCKVCKKDRFEKGTNLECKSCRGKKRRKKAKKKAVEYLGGKCQVCNYSECLEALDFHHIDINEKSFTLSRHWSWSIKRLKEELEKCVLLCCRCHREFHSGHITPKFKAMSKKIILCEDIKKKEIKRCSLCSNETFGSKVTGLCSTCYKKSIRMVERPSKEKLEALIKEKTWTNIGQKYKVSDNAIRNWAKSYGLL